MVIKNQRKKLLKPDSGRSITLFWCVSGGLSCLVSERARELHTGIFPLKRWNAQPVRERETHS